MPTPVPPSEPCSWPHRLPGGSELPSVRPETVQGKPAGSRPPPRVPGSSVVRFGRLSSPPLPTRARLQAKGGVRDLPRARPRRACLPQTLKSWVPHLNNGRRSQPAPSRRCQRAVWLVLGTPSLHLGLGLGRAQGCRKAEQTEPQRLREASRCPRGAHGPLLPSPCPPWAWAAEGQAFVGRLLWFRPVRGA